MRSDIPLQFIALLVVAFALNSQSNGQSQPTAVPATTSQSATQSQPQQRSPGGDVGSGTADIGKGAAKGTGAVAKGAGKGAGDLVTLHPLDAAGNVGKGAAVAGKDVGTGAAKGTGKIVKGTGKGAGKIVHHSDQDKPPSPSAPDASHDRG